MSSNAADKRAEDPVASVPVSPVPSKEREADAIYQNGELVARAIGPQVDLEAKEIRFAEVYNSDDLVLPHQVDATIPPIVSAAVGRGMALNPSQRYQSIADMRAVLWPDATVRTAFTSTPQHNVRSSRASTTRASSPSISEQPARPRGHRLAPIPTSSRT